MYVCYRSVYSLAGKSLGFAIDRGPFITSWSTFGLLVAGATLSLICRVVRIQPGAVRKRRGGDGGCCRGGQGRLQRKGRAVLGLEGSMRVPPLSQASFPPRYVELVNAACNFEPHESFFSLFSDPRSTRLTRIHLREDLVQDQDLEAIRKQVRPGHQAPGMARGGHPETVRQSWGRTGHLQPRNPEAPPGLSPSCRPLPKPHVWLRARPRLGCGCRGDNGAVPAARTWWSCT